VIVFGRQQLEMESAVSNVGSSFTDDQVNSITSSSSSSSYPASVNVYMCDILMSDICDDVTCRQQLEMESAVSNVGSSFTDDQVNELTLRHFENLQVYSLSHLILAIMIIIIIISQIFYCHSHIVSCLSVCLQYIVIF